MQERFLKIRRVLIITLILNWSVALAKVIYGVITRCSAMSADGFHSLSDGASNIIGIVGVVVASQPVDREHPYGHKKYETFAAIIISMMLFLISFHIIHDSVSRIFKPVLPDVTLTSFIVMIMTMLVNAYVMFYELQKARKLKSDILWADAQHTRSDILVSISVIFTLLAIRYGFPMLDTIVSILIALLIGYGAFSILRESSGILCDKAPVLVADEIKNIVLNIKGVKDCHKIRTRGRQDDIHLDLHIIVDTSMDVNSAHNLNHAIEKAIKDKIAGVTDVVVHIEPGTKDEKSMAD